MPLIPGICCCCYVTPTFIVLALLPHVLRCHELLVALFPTALFPGVPWWDAWRRSLLSRKSYSAAGDDIVRGRRALYDGVERDNSG